MAIYCNIINQSIYYLLLKVRIKKFQKENIHTIEQNSFHRLIFSMNNQFL